MQEICIDIWGRRDRNKRRCNAGLQRDLRVWGLEANEKMTYLLPAKDKRGDQCASA